MLDQNAMKTRALLLVTSCMLAEFIMFVHGANLTSKVQTEKQKAKELLEEIQKYMQNVIEQMKNTTDEPERREYRYDIFPGTNWCGPGDISPDGNQLGHLEGTDACCRQHDKCPYAINARKEKWGFQNNNKYTMSACECDDTFRKCLLEVPKAEGSKWQLSYYKNKVDRTAALAVGQMFFDWLGMQCLQNTHYFDKDEEEKPAEVDSESSSDKPPPSDRPADVGIRVTARKPESFPFWDS